MFHKFLWLKKPWEKPYSPQMILSNQLQVGCISNLRSNGLSIAVILDPPYKTQFVEVWFSKLYGLGSTDSRWAPFVVNVPSKSNLSSSSNSSLSKLDIGRINKFDVSNYSSDYFWCNQCIILYSSPFDIDSYTSFVDVDIAFNLYSFILIYQFFNIALILRIIYHTLRVWLLYSDMIIFLCRGPELDLWSCHDYCMCWSIVSILICFM